MERKSKINQNKTPPLQHKSRPKPTQLNSITDSRFQNLNRLPTLGANCKLRLFCSSSRLFTCSPLPSLFGNSGCCVCFGGHVFCTRFAGCRKYGVVGDSDTVSSSLCCRGVVGRGVPGVLVTPSVVVVESCFTGVGAKMTLLQTSGGDGDAATLAGEELRLRNSLEGLMSVPRRLALPAIAARLNRPFGGSMLLRRRCPPRGMRDVSMTYGVSSSQLFARSQLRNW